MINCQRSELYSIIHEKRYANLTKALYQISSIAHKFPNSGSITRLLNNFYAILEQKKDLCEQQAILLISIAVDIAYKNPRTYPLVSAILSKLVLRFLDPVNQEDIIEKIHKKFRNIPNIGFWELWLQRITIKTKNTHEQDKYNQLLCKKVNQIKSEPIWCSDWLSPPLKKIIDSYDVVNREKLEEIGNEIGKEEIECVILK